MVTQQLPKDFKFSMVASPQLPGGTTPSIVQWKRVQVVSHELLAIRKRLIMAAPQTA